ncbi:MAG: hypothetical protein H7A01_13980 [Hahellaceae bacterium]|nr:hypothetical protein [Hahellaceae bacterium]MCP5210165.1 hypothetical protein [Hahellaceae bacterium]
MKYGISLALSLTLGLTGCGGSDSSSSSSQQATTNSESLTNSTTCATGVTVPTKLVGKWESDISRNGSVGVATLIFNQDCSLQYYEVGDDQIMREWMSGMQSGKEYLYQSQPEQTLTYFDHDNYMAEEIEAEAQIYDFETTELVVKWPITSMGGNVNYKLSNNNQTLITSMVIGNGLTFERTYNKVK